jgi:hypothetical protein
MRKRIACCIVLLLAAGAVYTPFVRIAYIGPVVLPERGLFGSSGNGACRRSTHTSVSLLLCAKPTLSRRGHAPVGNQIL